MFRHKRVGLVDDHQPPARKEGERADLIENGGQRQSLGPGNRLMPASRSSSGRTARATAEIDSRIRYESSPKTA